MAACLCRERTTGYFRNLEDMSDPNARLLHCYLYMRKNHEKRLNLSFPGHQLANLRMILDCISSLTRFHSSLGGLSPVEERKPPISVWAATRQLIRELIVLETASSSARLSICCPCRKRVDIETDYRLPLKRLGTPCCDLGPSEHHGLAQTNRIQPIEVSYGVPEKEHPSLRFSKHYGNLTNRK